MSASPRTPLIAGNWKMLGSESLVRAMVQAVRERAPREVEVAIMPPAVYLALAAGLAAGRPAVGAQDLSAHAEGAYTGEISGRMLAECGARYVIVGHSERRQYHGETDAVVAGKFGRAREAGLVPVLCVGELLDQRERDETERVVGAQIDAVIDRFGVEALEGAVIAYEPVWAIGTGRSATPGQAQQVHAFIRRRVADRDGTIARSLRILYGGSMKPQNAAELLGCEDIDGGLIGGASLEVESFLAIVSAAAGQ